VPKLVPKLVPTLGLCLVAAAGLLAIGAAHAGVIAYGYPYASRCPGAGLAERVDRWKMYDCNCTSYVAWALSANGQRTDWFIPGSMDARNWAHVARLRGIPVGKLPRVGAVAVWPRLSRLGHVAYVTRLEPGGGFDVGEYNLPAVGDEDSFAFDVRRDAPRAGAVFLYVPKKRGI
jgi:surface antigen